MVNQFSGFQEECDLETISDLKELERITCLHLIEEALPNVRGRNIVIWGTREKGALAKEIIEGLGCTCKFFINSRSKTNMCYGLPLLTPDVLDVEKYYVIVATMSIEVDQFLQHVGYKPAGQDCILIAGRWHEDILFHGRFVGRGSYGYEFLTESFERLVKRIGRYCSISKYARIASNASLNYASTNPFLWSQAYGPARCEFQSQVEKFGMSTFYALPTDDQLVEIGNDVWIGMTVVILPGVKIGDGAILGAGAIVTKNVEPYAIVEGVPSSKTHQIPIA